MPNRQNKAVNRSRRAIRKTRQKNWLASPSPVSASVVVSVGYRRCRMARLVVARGEAAEGGGDGV
ncbi:MAG: hypothetical protein N2C12_02240 [Planctomycetales bacterium]